MLVEQRNIFGHDGQHGHLEEVLHVLHRLHAGIEIFEEECQADAENQSDDDRERHVEQDFRFGRSGGRLRFFPNARRTHRHAALHGLGRETQFGGFEDFFGLDVIVFGAPVFRAARLGFTLLQAGFLEVFLHFGHGALGNLQVGHERAPDAVDLLGQLLFVGGFFGLQGKDVGVACAETGLQGAGQLGADLLILRQDRGNSLILDLKRRQRAHQLVTGELFDLVVFGAKIGSLGARLARELFLLLQHGFLRLHGILEAVRVEVRDAELRADPAHFVVGFLHFLALFGNLVLQGGEGSGQDLLLLLDAFALVFLRDTVGQIGRFLRVRALDADLQEVGVTHLAHVDHAAQFEVSLLLRADAEFLAPPVDQIQRVDHRVKHLFPLDDLELRRGKTRIHAHRPLVTLGENPDLLLVLFDLDDDVRLVLARQEVSRHARGDHDQQESENDDRQAQSDDAPVIKEVQFSFLHGGSFAVSHGFYLSSSTVAAGR